MATKEHMIAALTDRISQIKDANVLAYINKVLVEELFHLDSPLALERPNAEDTMYTQSAFERQAIRRQLNDIAPGLGEDADVIEQYAMLAAMAAKENMKEGKPISRELHDILSGKLR